VSTLTGILTLLLACIGNAEWWVIWVNRWHAAPMRHAQLRHIRKLHDLGVVLFPVFVIALTGFGKDGLLFGGRFQTQNLFNQILLGLGLTGVIPFTAGVLRWQLRRMPAAVVESSSRRFDARDHASSPEHHALITGDQSSLLSRLPLNEIYSLDVSTRHIVIHRNRSHKSAAPDDSPRNHQPDISQATQPQAAPRSLTVAHFSDVHLLGCPGRGFHDFVTERLCELQPDAFMFTGDLLDEQSLLPWAVDMFSRMAEVAPGYFILGNHDWHLDHDLIRDSLVATGWTDVGSKAIKITLNGVPICLAGTEVPWIGTQPEVPAPSDESLRILLSHSPDQRDFAVANHFDVLLAGHNHGGQVVLPVVGPVYSPSRYGVQYAAGVFQHESLLMHISRGIAGKDQLRWNCPPEVSLLKLILPEDA
jgi:predicted MPP superfamily phosphohydrolase